ncbi:lycopene cyclase family protein [uncultured Psychroserpens sp.]|uniref:lycopene cyclase family protein n=1 Tax=uncultured Psychroserpens sp. TaxID=255436 RepID=UPI00260F8341|nr:lycopene cyclase family protein [uncultured Psychroserpens sp.]
MTHRSHFDYIIIGNGLAGLQLALKLASDSYFKNLQIALIDPIEKNTNDKTWSFWDIEPSQWNHLTHKSWTNASIITSKKRIDLQLNPYAYKTVRAIDFYTNALTTLRAHKTIHFIKERVTSVIDNDNVSVVTNRNTYTASHVFDSRVPNEFTEASKTRNTSIIQHFKGWMISTETDTFDDQNVTMMDYRLKDGEQTTFTYILPFSKREALIEFTYFTEHLVDEPIYDSFLKTYIKTVLNIDAYTVLEEETGQIPMTSYNFSKHNTNNITKIGTGGGWVKGSTGYSLKHTEKKVSLLIENIKNGKPPSHQLFKRKHRFYDKVFLKVLKDENHKGEWLFEQFYSKNSVQTMFKFLDEESSLLEDLKIMSSLFSWSFIKAFFKTL